MSRPCIRRRAWGRLSALAIDEERVVGAVLAVCHLECCLVGECVLVAHDKSVEGELGVHLGDIVHQGVCRAPLVACGLARGVLVKPRILGVSLQRRGCRRWGWRCRLRRWRHPSACLLGRHCRVWGERGCVWVLYKRDVECGWLEGCLGEALVDDVEVLREAVLHRTAVCLYVEHAGIKRCWGAAAQHGHDRAGQVTLAHQVEHVLPQCLGV